MEFDAGNDVSTTTSRLSSDNANTPLPRQARTRSGRLKLLTLDVLDGRTSSTRSVLELIATMVDTLGGEKSLTFFQKDIISHAAIIGAMAEDAAARWIIGQPIDRNEYFSAVKNHLRFLLALGLHTQTKDSGELNSITALLEHDRRETQRELREQRAKEAAAPIDVEATS